MMKLLGNGRFKSGVEGAVSNGMHQFSWMKREDFLRGNKRIGDFYFSLILGGLCKEIVVRSPTA